MKKNQSVLWGIGIVACAVIVYFGFVDPITNEDDLKGTVGAVKKHQTEQIQNADVVLAGEAAPATYTTQEVIAAKAALLERASTQDLGVVLRTATPKELGDGFGRVSVDALARAFETLEKGPDENR